MLLGMEANQANTVGVSHIDAAIGIVRACGPVGRGEIAAEILAQATNGTASNCLWLADAAIRHGLETGWLERYDDIEDAYVMARS